MTLPTLPQVTVDTTYVPPTGRTIAVAAGGDVQAALNSANFGDVVTLAAGATFTGPFTLPAKSGTGWITVRSSAADSALPPLGTRITPASAPLMPKLVVGAGGSAIQTASGAHHYRFIGIEVRPLPGAVVVLLVRLGSGENNPTLLPHDIIFDRCYVHGDPTAGTMRGIVLDCARAAVIDSTVTDIKHMTTDATAVWSSNGPGPFKIVNNYLAGTGQSVMFGGQDPSIPNLVTSDVEVRGNYMTKPLSWRVGDPAYAGTHWMIKNLFELKNAKRVLIDGNVFEYSWPDAPLGQDGFAVFFTPRNQSGGAPWATVEDVTFTHNIVRHATDGIAIHGTDNNFPSQQTKRVLIQHNLFYGIGDYITMPHAFYGGDLIGMDTGAPDNITVDHNTAFMTHDSIVVNTSPASPTNVAFTNNLVPNGPDGVNVGSLGSGAVVAGNVILGGVAGNYPAGNFFPAGGTPVVNAYYGGTDFSLVSGSPYLSAGTDGKAVGADIAAVLAATAYAVTGLAPAPPVPVPPPPVAPVWTVNIVSAATGSAIIVQKNGVVVFTG